MDVLEEVQPLWTYLRKCNVLEEVVDVLEEVLMDVLEEVQPLWTYLRKCNPYGRT